MFSTGNIKAEVKGQTLHLEIDLSKRLGPSASGKTVFIEPMDVVNLNNQIRELEFAQQREITRILQEFAGFLRPYLPDLIEQARFLGTIDFIHIHHQLCNAGVYQFHSAEPADVGFDHHGIHTPDFTADSHQFCNGST